MLRSELKERLDHILTTDPDGILQFPKLTHRLTYSHRHSCSVQKRRVWYVDRTPYGHEVGADDRCFGLLAVKRMRDRGKRVELHPHFDGFIVIEE